MGVRPPYLLSHTKLAGKIFFATYSNYLIYKNIIFGLNRCILIDTDGKIGSSGLNADPDFQPGNIGFEIEILLGIETK